MSNQITLSADKLFGLLRIYIMLIFILFKYYAVIFSLSILYVQGFLCLDSKSPPPPPPWKFIKALSRVGMTVF